MKRVSGRGIILLCETIVFSVIVPGAVTFWIPRAVLGISGQTSPKSWSIRHVAALVPLMLCLAIYLRCLWEFAARGRGIPAPVDHPKQLVVTGLYRYVRNPMYVGVLILLIGVVILFRSTNLLIYTACWFAFVHLNVLLWEESPLRHQFGDSYTRHLA